MNTITDARDLTRATNEMSVTARMDRTRQEHKSRSDAVNRLIDEAQAIKTRLYLSYIFNAVAVFAIVASTAFGR